MKAATRSASTVAWWWLASRSAPSRLRSSASADASSNARCCLRANVAATSAVRKMTCKPLRQTQYQSRDGRLAAREEGGDYRDTGCERLSVGARQVLRVTCLL